MEAPPPAKRAPGKTVVVSLPASRHFWRMENLARIWKKFWLLVFTAFFAFEFANFTYGSDVESAFLELARLIFALVVCSLVPALALQWVARKLIAVALPYRRAYLLTAANLLLLYGTFRLLQMILPASSQTSLIGAVACLVATALLYAHVIKQENGNAIGYWRGFKVVAVPAAAVVLVVGGSVLLIGFCVTRGIGGRM